MKKLLLMILLTACGEKPETTRVLLVGDSIVAKASLKGQSAGWGQYLTLPGHEITNNGLGGKSSKSYWNDYWWGSFTFSYPDVVFLEFGHNDSKPEPERHTDPQTSYKVYLKEFIDSVRAKNKTIVFVTPPERIEHTGCVSDRNLEPYVIAMKEVAEDNDVQLIDLWSYSVELFESDCYETAAKIFAPDDGVHMSHYGADLYARFIAKEYLK